MITKEQAMELHLGQTLYHTDNRNSDGSPQRWRVNGQCKTWKTRPAEFQVPLKHGLRTYDYLTHAVGEKLCLTEDEALEDTELRKTKRGVLEILKSEMASVAANLDAGKMDCFSLNAVRDKCIDAGVFDSPNDALFWFADNKCWVGTTHALLNQEFRLPPV